MMYCDAVSYLPDDILCKVDRASMAVSLETRAPFLDHRVAALAARIPAANENPRRRRQAGCSQGTALRHAPREPVRAAQGGLRDPGRRMDQGPLRAWAEELLDPAALRAEGWFDADKVARRWREHLAGQRDSTPALWAILMFQALAAGATRRSKPRAAA